jgi:LysM repeat protein
MISGNKKVQFPIAPSELTINVNGRNESIDLMNEGEVNLLKSPGLTEISFKALIPQLNKYSFAVNSEPIDTFTKFLNEMLENKKPFRFVVVRTAGTKLLFDTNLQVACEGYEMHESAENGFDVELDISLKQYREYGVKTITLVSVQTTKKTDTTTNKTTTTTSNKNTTTTTASTNNKRPTPAKSNKYTVKKGDTLWSIAKKYYGSGSKWQNIWNKNKSILDSTAKKHGKKDSSKGHWIYPGTVLTIP